jgi:hypothetical protein
MEREPGAQARAIRALATHMHYADSSPKAQRLMRSYIARDLGVNAGSVWTALRAKSDKPGRPKTHNATSVRVRQLEKAARAVVAACASMRNDDLVAAISALKSIL